MRDISHLPSEPGNQARSDRLDRAVSEDNMITYNSFQPKQTPLFRNNITLTKSRGNYQLRSCGFVLMQRDSSGKFPWVAINVLGYPIAELKYLFTITKKADKFIAGLDNV